MVGQAFGVITRRIVLSQLSPMSLAVVSHEPFILESESLIIWYGVAK